MWFTGAIGNANNDNTQPSIYNVDSGTGQWTPEALQKCSTIQSSIHSNMLPEQVDWALLAKQWIAMQQSQKQQIQSESISGSMRREEIRQQEPNSFFSNQGSDNNWREPHLLATPPIHPIVNPQIPQMSLVLPAPTSLPPPSPSSSASSAACPSYYQISSAPSTLPIHLQLKPHPFQRPSLDRCLPSLHHSSLAIASSNALPPASSLPAPIQSASSSFPQLSTSVSANTHLPSQPFWIQSSSSSSHGAHHRNSLNYPASKEGSNFHNRTLAHASKHSIVEANSGIDINKRKQLPAWIREGLEKMEREKMKKIEKEKEDEERLEMMRIQKDEEERLRKEIEMENEKRKSNKEEEDDDDKYESSSGYHHHHHYHYLGKESNTEYRANHKSGHITELYESEEEREKELMFRVKKSMTEILLEVTEEVITNVVKDFVFKLKNSRGGIVTGYESDSHSSTDRSPQMDTRLNDSKCDFNLHDTKQTNLSQNKQELNNEESKNDKVYNKHRSSRSSESKSKDRHRRRKSKSRSRSRQRSRSRSQSKSSRHLNRKVKSRSRSRSRDRRYKRSRRSRSKSSSRSRSSNYKSSDRRR